MTLRKIFFGLFVYLFVFLSQEISTTFAEDKLVVGYAGPLTGQIGWLGTNIKNGILYFLKQNPEAASRIDLVIEDTGSTSAASGLSAVNKLIEINKVDVLIISHSATLNAAAPVIERLGIPTIGITGDDVAENKKFIVKLYMPLKNYGKAINAEIDKHQDKSRYALVTTEYDSTLKRAAAVRNLIKNKASIVFDETVSSSVDIPAVALRLAAKKADIIVMNLMPGQVGPFAKKLKEYKVNAVIIGPDSIAEKSELDLAQGALENALYVDSALSERFIVQYQKDFNDYPPNRFPHGYDAINIISNAFANTDFQDDHQALNSLIRVKNFFGALGAYSIAGDSSNCFDLQAVIRKIQLPILAK